VRRQSDNGEPAHLSPAKPAREATTASGGAAPPLSPAGIQALQRAAGNSAVARMLARDEHTHGPGCGHGAPAPVQRSSVHTTLSSSGRPLDGALRSEMEARLGADFGDVRLHTDSAAQRSAAEVGARAYTSGSHVVIGDGGGDKHTLAHELTHVIQQRKGPVAGTDNGNGLSVSDPGDRFEREAEANARQVMSGAVPQRAADEGAAERVGPAAGEPAAVQRAEFRQTAATNATDRDVVLRMLDRISRIALDTITKENANDVHRKTKQPNRSAKKITPHLAATLLPGNTLAIAGNTGKRKVTDLDKKNVNEEIRKFVEQTAAAEGHGTPKDRTKLRAQVAGDYATAHPGAEGLETLTAALERPIEWFVVGQDEPDSKMGAQHGEMTLLGEHVRNWKANPGDPAHPKTVMMGGVKKACLSCRWAFDAVNEVVGAEYGYRVQAAGSHEQFFPGWIMPEWMRNEPGLREAMVEKTGQLPGVALVGDEMVGAMSELVGSHDPDASGSEWEE
jgi:hypothetical protein